MSERTRFSAPTQLNKVKVPPSYLNEDLTQAMEPIRPQQLPSLPVFTPPPAPRPQQPAIVQTRAAAPSASGGHWLRYFYLLTALGVVGLALILTVSALLFNHSVQARDESDGAALVVSSANPAPGAPADGGAALAAPTLVPVASATPGLAIQPWDGTQRFTMLVMGLDKRPGEGGSAFRTDTLIIVSLDPLTHSVGMLSVPRDLYVSIPPNTVVGSSYGLQRINAAYVIGESVRPGYGPLLAMQTVQYNLGIRINSYLVVDFTSVIGAVDTVGGVDIDVPQPLYDAQYPSMNYGYEPLYIPAGHIHMDGQLALKYARSRHGSSDLDRAKRQQQVINAIRAKILSADMVPKLIAQAPFLWAQYASSLKTDLPLDQLLRLGVYAKDIPQSNIHQGVIDYGYVTSQMWQGMSILVPNRAAIGPLMAQVFGANYNR